jgi:hypothetical protein
MKCARVFSPVTFARVCVTSFLCSILMLPCVVAAETVAAPEPTDADLTPFVLPWDDGAPGPTDVSFLNHTPAGKFGVIHAGSDGHFYAGTQRVRFLGVNLCFGALAPEKADAERIAARMAKFGINAVRFHHGDTQRFPAGLIKRDGRLSGELDPQALDRLDYLVAELKKRGIYADLNLLVGRKFCAADGLPAEIETLDWKVRHTMGMFYPPMLELQKQYARDLLGHKNAYTGSRYADEPAVAIVEINNENGLIQQWLAGELDQLPKPFADELRRLWNEWLAGRYASTAAVAKAWDSRSEPLGAEMLTPFATSGAGGQKAKGDPKWRLEQHGQAKASVNYERVDGKSAARVTVVQADDQGWHVQFNQAGVQVRKGRLYTVALRVRADKPRVVELALGQAHDPWGPLGLSAKIDAGSTWREEHVAFVANDDDENARVNITGLAREVGSIWVADVSLRSGGVLGLEKGETIEARQAPIIQRNARRPWSREAQTDYITFLRDTEGRYWEAMRQCVKEELGFKGVVMGTIVGCSTPNLQAGFDAVDGHSYWKHPNFPNRPWDPEDWTVGNLSMANEVGGTLAGLSMQRVQGKPFTVTEYNHAAPNTYSSEAPLLLAAHAALQDWDGLFLFAYSHSGRWDTRRIGSFFDIDQHPTKMVNLPLAAMIFRGGQVQAAKELVVSTLPAGSEAALIQQHGRPWKQIEQDQLGLSLAVSLLHRTALRVGTGNAPVVAKASVPDRSNVTSDTGEITWDRRRPEHGVVIIDTTTCKGVIGFGSGESFKLGDVTIEPGANLQGWSTACASLIEGKSFTSRGRVLVAVTGYAQNTGMRWKTPEHTSVGRNWGEAPSRVEIVPVKITLPVPPERLQAWALNERGQHAAPIQPQATAPGHSILSLGEQETLWYEIAIR